MSEHRPLPDPSHDLTPRKPRTVGGVGYLVVLAASLVGLAITATGRWEAGLNTLGIAMTAGGVLRLVLPDREGGMLHIRRKFVDVMTLLAMGVGLLVLASVIPPAGPLAG